MAEQKEKKKQLDREWKEKEKKLVEEGKKPFFLKKCVFYFYFLKSAHNYCTILCYI